MYQFTVNIYIYVCVYAQKYTETVQELQIFQQHSTVQVKIVTLIEDFSRMTLPCFSHKGIVIFASHAPYTLYQLSI